MQSDKISDSNERKDKLQKDVINTEYSKSISNVSIHFYFSYYINLFLSPVCIYTRYPNEKAGCENAL